jgi:hypothetical protein
MGSVAVDVRKHEPGYVDHLQDPSLGDKSGFKLVGQD